MKNILTIGLGVFLVMGMLSFGIFYPNSSSNLYLSKQVEFEKTLDRYYEEQRPIREIKLLKENFEKYRLSSLGIIHRFIDLKSLAIVLGGSFAASLIAFRGRVAFGGIKQFFMIFGRDVKDKDFETAYYQILEFAEKRMDGDIISDEQIDQIRDEYFQSWVADFIAVDLVSEEVMKEIVNSEIEKFTYTQYRELEILAHYSKSLPAFGMIGTVIGLVLMLSSATETTANLANLMGAMSIALITTLYGVILSYGLFSPALNKRKIRIDAKIHLLEMIKTGVFSLYENENPEIIKKNIINFLPTRIKLKIYRESANNAGPENLGL